MKKSLLLSITGITLVALTATTLYAQTTTGNSVISKMKAAVSAFTLAGDLNPGQTGLQSAPVSGKKTGDILTAGEWNRVLEIIASAGGGVSDVELITSQAPSPAATADYSFRVSQANCPAGKKIISGGCSYPNTLNTFVHNTPTPDLTGWICGGLHHDGDTTNNTTKYPYRPTAYAVCGTYGSGGGSGEMVMSEMSPIAYVNLIDAVDYCRNLTENGITHWRFPTYGDLVNFIDAKYPQDMIWVADFDGTQIASQTITKNYFGSIRLSDGYWSVTTPADTANKVRCVAQTGGGSVSGNPAFYYCTNAQSLDPNNAPCYGAKQNQGSGNGRYRTLVAHLSFPSYSPSNLSMFPWHDGTKWKCAVSGVGHFDCTDGSVLVADTQASGGGSSSGWSDIVLQGATSFDVNCEYRFKASAPGNTDDDAFIGDDNAFNYIQRVHANRLTYQHIGTAYEHINADTKTTLRQNGTPASPAQTITQIQKRCN